MKGVFYGVNPVGWATCKWMRRLWPGCLLTPLNGVALREVPPPDLPADDWVRCRTVLGGVCGSDVALVLQRQPANSILQSFSTLPAVMGHENVAVVEQAGPAVDPSWLGRRVCVEPTLCCRARGIDPPCPPCRGGQYGACENFSADGLGASRLPPGTSLGYCRPVGGSWGEQFVAHVSQLVGVPEGLSDAAAVLTDPLACALHAVLRRRKGEGQDERVLVYGAGILGLGVVWALRRTGFRGRIDVAARHEHQRHWAGKLGADEALRLPADRRARFQAVARHTGARLTRARFGNYMLSGGYDAVFDCAGTRTTIEESLKFARARGQVVLVATGHGRGTDLTSLWFRELSVVGAYGRGQEDFNGRPIHTYALTHELILSDAADLAAMVTHTFPLRRYKAALTAAMGKAATGAIKVAFDFSAAG